MAKQFLSLHTIENAHPTDIFSLAVTTTQIFSGSGSSTINIHSTTGEGFPLFQALEGAHKLGCHHIAASKDGYKVASVGFGGELKIWSMRVEGNQGIWAEEEKILDTAKAGELWAIALSADGQYLASTTYDGRINVWDILDKAERIKEFETKKSFGMCIDLSADGNLTASGHENGGVYVFNNASGRMLHSLPGLVKPVRSVAFSPGGKLLAAGGDSKIIALYDVSSGEQIANLTGHGAWVFSVDWNHTGEYLLSSAFDGKIKVWSIDRRTCVATHTQTDKAVWSAKWLPKTRRDEGFAVAGANRSISFYREATGG